MINGMENHTVSLTKNGYFKLIDLIVEYPAKEILGHLGAISMDEAQAVKMLGGNSRQSTVPPIWDDIRDNCNKSESASLLMISILFSHKDLIKWLIQANASEMVGILRRQPDYEKEYTNLAFSLNQAGFADGFRPRTDETWFDFTPMLASPKIGRYARKVIENQLARMGWFDGQGGPFQRSFFEQCKAFAFNKVLGLSWEQFENWLEGRPVTIAHASSAPMPFDPAAFTQALAAASLRIPEHTVIRFISALLAKPFVILTGLSGSGKTKLAEAFALWLAKIPQRQICFVSVGADWTNREPLLGYPNALEQGHYVKPDCGALDLLLTANAHPDLPCFLILDEMNLSHVERYFADFLSAMEAAGRNLALHPATQAWDGCEVPASLALPRNLFIIGTVNIDETTYMFSPKVLDRAQVIEFRVESEEMERFMASPDPIDMGRLVKAGANMAGDFLERAQQQLMVPTDLQAALIPFFDQLQAVGAEFGYRSAAEVARFAAVWDALAGPSPDRDTVLDAAILQKLLPKLHGSRNRLERILLALGRLCLTDSTLEPFKDPTPALKYTLSYEKLGRMHKRVIADGFTSYAEA